MITYFKMKRKQWKIKNMIYDSILAFIENKKDILSTAKNLFDSMKDMTGDELKEEIISKVVEMTIKKSQNETEDE